jgi:hypothetical protein
MDGYRREILTQLGMKQLPQTQTELGAHVRQDKFTTGRGPLVNSNTFTQILFTTVRTS